MTATHSFDAVGTYPVTLTVTDPQGATGTDSVDVTITGPNQAPTASGTSSGSVVAVGSQVYLDGTGSSDPEGGPLTYSWDFGDGGSTVDSTERYATVVYDSPGAKTVTLTVTDAGRA